MLPCPCCGVFAEVLRGSYWAKKGTLQAVADEALRVRELLPESTEVAEFASLASQAANLEGESSS